MEKDGLGNHTLSMENRQRAALTGIAEVLAFAENQVILRTDTGEIALALTAESARYSVYELMAAPSALFVPAAARVADSGTETLMRVSTSPPTFTSKPSGSVWQAANPKTTNAKANSFFIIFGF